MKLQAQHLRFNNKALASNALRCHCQEKLQTTFVCRQPESCFSTLMCLHFYTLSCCLRRTPAAQTRGAGRPGAVPRPAHTAAACRAQSHTRPDHCLQKRYVAMEHRDVAASQGHGCGAAEKCRTTPAAPRSARGRRATRAPSTYSSDWPSEPISRMTAGACTAR